MKNIYLFTNWFPYGQFSENFLNQEIQAASRDCNITIVPMIPSKFKRKIPDNVKVDDSIARMSLLKKGCILIKTLFSCQLWRTIFKEEKRISFPKFLMFSLKYTFGSNIILSYFDSKRHTIESDSILYSYWMSYIALGLAEAKAKYEELRGCTLVSRAHGYDVYEEMRDVFIPKRAFTVKQFDKIYSVSETGKHFLQERYCDFMDTIQCRYLGIKPINGNTKKVEGLTSFISCSSVYPIKRVDLIYKSICKYVKKHPNNQYTWTHIGKGISEEELNGLQVIPNNLKVELKGRMSNLEIYKIYESQHFDLFINLSLSEGLPVSIMEAISASIPVVATDAGGTKEIVTTESGVIIPINFTQDEFESAVDYVITNYDSLSDSARKFYMNNFVAKNNYLNFYNEIQNLK